MFIRRRDHSRGSDSILASRGESVGTGFRIREFVFDVIYAFRVLRKAPSFALAAVLVLALGSGGVIMMFSLVDGVLLRPLPYKDPNRLVRILHIDRTSGRVVTAISQGEFVEYQSRAATLDTLAFTQPEIIPVQRTDEVVQVKGARVSEAFFRLLGVPPRAGRWLLPDEHSTGAQDVVVVSHRFWMEHCGGDLALIGKKIDQQHTVVGIMPPGFEYPDESGFWLPFKQRPDPYVYTGFSLRALGRLKPGSTVDQAEAELTYLYERILKMWQRPDFPVRGTRVERLQDEMVGPVRQGLLLLAGAALCVLLVACSNLANLLIAKGVGRQREIAIRASLGAGRFRLIRQLLTESLLVAMAGIGVGLLLAQWGLIAFLSAAPKDLPRVAEVAMNSRVAAFSAALCVVTAAVFGVLPAFELTRAGIRHALNVSAGSVASSQRRLSGGLVVVQIALSLTLLTGAGLLMRSFVLLLRVNLGFEPAGILVASTSNRNLEFQRQAIERLRLLPSVTAVGCITGLPLAGPWYMSDPTFDGLSPAVRLAKIRVLIQVATPAYFRAMGIPLRRGRLLQETDTQGAAPVAVVNETLARMFFPDQDPIGKRVVGGPVIVGVVGDVRNRDLASDPTPEMYYPLGQREWWSYTNFVIRTTGDPAALASAVRAELRALDKNRTSVQTAPLDRRLAATLAPQRLRAWMISAFAGLALVLAAIGVYGIVSYSAQQRIREFGIRIALGATPAELLWLVLRQGLWLTAAGVALGIPCTLVATRGLRGLLFGIATTDVATLCAVSALLAAVGLCASYFPTRHLRTTNLAATLRYE